MRFLKSKGDVKYDHTNRILVRKKKNFEVVQVKLIFQYYKIILMYIKMVQRQRRHEVKTKSTYNE